MPSPKNVYGLFDPKKLNPNIVAIVAGVVVVTGIVVYSNRHIKMSFKDWWQIETFPPASHDSSTNKKVDPKVYPQASAALPGP